MFNIMRYAHVIWTTTDYDMYSHSCSKFPKRRVFFTFVTMLESIAIDACVIMFLLIKLTSCELFPRSTSKSASTTQYLGDTRPYFGHF